MFAKVDAASFEVAWYNKTLSMRECPEEQIAAARSFLLTREGAVRQRVVQVGSKSLHNIPYICHENHENSRVNFFWPV